MKRREVTFETTISDCQNCKLFYGGGYDCRHPNAPHEHLPCCKWDIEADQNYIPIPEWCPLAKENKK
jgi:hypothetical protein